MKPIHVIWINDNEAFNGGKTYVWKSNVGGTQFNDNYIPFVEKKEYDKLLNKLKELEYEKS